MPAKICWNQKNIGVRDLQIFRNHRKVISCGEFDDLGWEIIVSKFWNTIFTLFRRFKNGFNYGVHTNDN